MNPELMKRIAARTAFLKLFALLLILAVRPLSAQETQIRGFVDFLTDYNDKTEKVSFGFGEQDLFITSEISDRLSFLGESVFKFSLNSPTSFDVSIERVVIKYNFKGNHNLLVGKHHTPILYWNDSYHHGRVFFPTIKRPLLFEAGFVPLHTTGIAVQAENLGKAKFGYSLMIGNGVGSTDISDNDDNKAIIAAVNFKPHDTWKIGIAGYFDKFSHASAGHSHGGSDATEDITQTIGNLYIAHFGERFELLTEGTFSMNDGDSSKSHENMAVYAYAGVRLKDKWVPYVRFDMLDFDDSDPFYNTDNKTSILGGIRYEINYLANVKLEYQQLDSDAAGKSGIITAQFAIGF